MLTQEQIMARITPGPNACYSLVRILSDGPKFQTWLLSNDTILKINKLNGLVSVNLKYRFNSKNSYGKGLQ